MSKPVVPGEGIRIEVPKDFDKDDKTEEKNKGESKPGESVKEGLKLLDTVGIKDGLEKGVKKVDPETPDEISKESLLITERINKLDILITIGLYYSSLFMNWLTLLGRSTSVQNFFYELLLGSFNIKDWDFGDLSLVARISGMSTTLQTAIFSISGIINLGARILNKPVPEIVGGPMYFGGPFQIIYALFPRAKDYTDSIKSLDAKVSQWIGFFSQVLVMIAAIHAGFNRVSALDPFTSGNIGLIGSGYVPKPNSEDQFGDVISPSNTTQITLAVQNAAIFARATYTVTVVAIVMTSLLNIIQWLADVWRVNKDELIIYTFFKVLTRILLCQPCGGDRCLGGSEKKGKEGKGGKGSIGLSRGIPSPSGSSPLKESITNPSLEKFDEKSPDSSISLPIPTEQENRSLLTPERSSPKKLGRTRSFKRK
jgi:hypothetical protein